MLSPKELYQKINASNLTIQEKDKWHDWYGAKHIKTTEISLWLLDKVGRWRQRKLSKLQKKVLRRLK